MLLRFPWLRRARPRFLRSWKWSRPSRGASSVGRLAVPITTEASVPVVTTVAEDDDSFIRAVGQAIQGNRGDSAEQRKAVARSNTWEARAEQFLDIVAQVLNSKRASAG